MGRGEEKKKENAHHWTMHIKKKEKSHQTTKDKLSKSVGGKKKKKIKYRLYSKDNYLGAQIWLDSKTIFPSY